MTVLIRRLLYCQIAFDHNGGSTLHFEFPENQLKWLEGTFETLRKRSEHEHTVLEVEIYKDGIYLEKA